MKSNGASMRALVLESYGSPLKLTVMSRPTPAHGQVLVRIMASGVNPLDLKIRAGQAAHAKTRPPAVLGIDLAGIVEEVGANVTGVTHLKPGDEVFGMTGGIGGVQGSLAEFAAVDADLLAIKPKRWSMREAAAVPLTFITAWEGLVDRANVHAKQKVLIHRGAGGVGHMAVQIARARGAEVFATEVAPRMAGLEQLGAVAIDHLTATSDYVAKYTGGQGFDIVYDTAGGATLDASFAAARTYVGHVVSCLGWGSHALAPLSFRGATYSGVFTLLPLLTGQHRAHHGYILSEAAKLAEAEKLTPHLDPRRFTLASIEDAYATIEARDARGKIVIDIAT